MSLISYSSLTHAFHTQAIPAQRILNTVHILDTDTNSQVTSLSKYAEFHDIAGTLINQQTTYFTFTALNSNRVLSLSFTCSDEPALLYLL